MHTMSLNVERKITSSHRYVVDHHDVFKSSLSNKRLLPFFYCICFVETQKIIGFCVRRYWILVDAIFQYISIYFKCPISFLMWFSQRVFSLIWGRHRIRRLLTHITIMIICRYCFRAFFDEMIWKIYWWDQSKQNHIYIHRVRRYPCRDTLFSNSRIR